MKMKTGKSYTRGKFKNFRITTVIARHEVSLPESPVRCIEIAGYNAIDESDKVWIELERTDTTQLHEIYDAIGAMLGIDGELS